MCNKCSPEILNHLYVAGERDGEKRMKEKLFANHNTTGHFFVVGCTDGERERSCVTVCSRDRENSY